MSGGSPGDPRGGACRRPARGERPAPACWGKEARGPEEAQHFSAPWKNCGVGEVSPSLAASPPGELFHQTPLHSSQWEAEGVPRPAPPCLPKIWLWKGVPKNREGPLDGRTHRSQGRDLDSLREEARGAQAGVPEGAAGPTATTRGGRLALIWGVGRRGRDTDDGSHKVPAVTVQVEAVMGLGIEA